MSHCLHSTYTKEVDKIQHQLDKFSLDNLYTPFPIVIEIASKMGFFQKMSKLARLPHLTKVNKQEYNFNMPVSILNTFYKV